MDEAGVIVCGHTRWKAAQKLGLAEAPVATMAVMALNGLAVILGIAHEDAAEKSR